MRPPYDKYIVGGSEKNTTLPYSNAGSGSSEHYQWGAVIGVGGDPGIPLSLYQRSVLPRLFKIRRIVVHAKREYVINHTFSKYYFLSQGSPTLHFQKKKIVLVPLKPVFLREGVEGKIKAGEKDAHIVEISCPDRYPPLQE